MTKAIESKVGAICPYCGLLHPYMTVPQSKSRECDGCGKWFDVTLKINPMWVTTKRK